MKIRRILGAIGIIYALLMLTTKYDTIFENYGEHFSILILILLISLAWLVEGR